MLLTKQFFSWLLLLVVVFSTIPVTMATDLDQESQSIDCQMSLLQVSDIDLSDYCPMQYDDDSCQQHPSCVVQFTVAVLPLINTLHSAHRNTSRLNFIFETDPFATQYPSLLKRPPRS